MQLALNSRTTLEQNAGEYFEHAKKLRKKAQGARSTVTRLQTQLNKEQALSQHEIKKKEESAQHKSSKTKEWYDRFRWFISSDGILCVGGRDAVSNEIIVKKHATPKELIFHTETPGSPFFVIKEEREKIPTTTINEVAEATAIYSKAWKLGILVSDVYSVLPEQLSKTSASGEYVSRGAFVVSGKRNYTTVRVTQATIGILADGRIMGGPINAVKSQCKQFVTVTPGNNKASDIAKAIKKKIGGELDDIIAALPAGGCKL